MHFEFFIIFVVLGIFCHAAVVSSWESDKTEPIDETPLNWWLEEMEYLDANY